MVRRKGKIKSRPVNKLYCNITLRDVVCVMTCPGCAVLLAGFIACLAVFLEHVIRQDQCYQPPFREDE